jgi:hypothetical protein
MSQVNKTFSGFPKRTMGPITGSLARLSPISDTVVLPKITTPARRSRATRSLSVVAGTAFRAK